jgi:hypothetical protein
MSTLLELSNMCENQVSDFAKKFTVSFAPVEEIYSGLEERYGKTLRRVEFGADPVILARFLDASGGVEEVAQEYSMVSHRILDREMNVRLLEIGDLVGLLIEHCNDTWDCEVVSTEHTATLIELMNNIRQRFSALQELQVQRAKESSQ